MKSLPTEGYTALYFSTATIKGWKNLLKPDKYKEVITNAMSFLTEEESVWIYAFVIMPNHIHWVWQMRIFKDRPLSVALFSDKVVWQKISYIHQKSLWY